MNKVLQGTQYLKDLIDWGCIDADKPCNSWYTHGNAIHTKLNLAIEKHTRTLCETFNLPDSGAWCTESQYTSWVRVMLVTAFLQGEGRSFSRNGVVGVTVFSRVG